MVLLTYIGNFLVLKSIFEGVVDFVVLLKGESIGGNLPK